VAMTGTASTGAQIVICSNFLLLFWQQNRKVTQEVEQHNQTSCDSLHAQN